MAATIETAMNRQISRMRRVGIMTCRVLPDECLGSEGESARAAAPLRRDYMRLVFFLVISRLRNRAPWWKPSKYRRTHKDSREVHRERNTLSVPLRGEFEPSGSIRTRVKGRARKYRAAWLVNDGSTTRVEIDWRWGSRPHITRLAPRNRASGAGTRSIVMSEPKLRPSGPGNTAPTVNLRGAGSRQAFRSRELLRKSQRCACARALSSEK